jgi:hypothetical protein
MGATKTSNHDKIQITSLIRIKIELVDDILDQLLGLFECVITLPISTNEYLS